MRSTIRRCRWQKIIASVAILLAPFATQATSPLVDSAIENQASAQYIDGNNNSFTVQSNLSRIKVAQIYSATFEADRISSGAPGQTVYFNHLLTNTGNGDDEYTISIAQNNTAESGANNCAVIEVYQDGPINGAGNGVPDSGEARLHDGTGGGGTLTLSSGQFVNLVVACRIPGTASDGDDFGVTLTVAADGDGVNAATQVVTDTGGDADTTNGTNESTVTATGDAVLNVSKSATFDDNGTPNDPSDDTIVYEITVSNTGNAPAYNVEIRDEIDLTTHDVSAIGDITIISTSGNFVDTAATPDERGGTDTIEGAAPAVTDDVNRDTTTGDFGVLGHDDVLPTNTSVSVRFRVEVDPSGLNADKDTPSSGDRFENTATVIGDVDDDGDTGDAPETVTSTTFSPVPQIFGVNSEDTDENTGETVDGTIDTNDGQDDDGDNDDQFVSEVNAGAEVIFKHTITNQGNGPDTVEISVTNVDFPAGTVFTFFDATGNNQLLNTNGLGGLDTGEIAGGGVTTIVVKALLPASVSGAGIFNATLTASSGRALAEGETISDTTGLSLGAIVAPDVDLNNGSSPDNNAAVDDDAFTTGVFTPVTTVTGDPGDEVLFTLTVQNDSSTPSSFQLQAGGSISGTTLGDLPAGFDVVFRDAATSGSVLNSTPSIGANDSFTVFAFISIPNNAEDTEANHVADIDGNPGDETVDANDSDGDYAIFFKAVSAATGAADIKLDAVDVNDVEQVEIDTNNTGQVQPGGSVDYPNVVRNTGNTVEVIELSGSNTGTGFGNAILVDTDNDGVPDTAFGSLSPGDTIFVRNSGGALTALVLGDDGGGDPTITLNPGETVDIIAKVFSPTSAGNGDTDTNILSASYNGAANSTTATNTTNVVLGQLRLTKTNAPDDNCDGEPNGGATFLQIQPDSTRVEPGNCVVWQVVGSNDGTAMVDDVRIYDGTPNVSSYLAGSMRSCAGNAGTDADGSGCPGADINAAGNAHTDAAGAEAGHTADDNRAEASGGNLTFFVGTGATDTVGGGMAPGATVTVRFTTQVNN